MKIIGVVHLKALPGSPFYLNNLSEIYETALEDSINLENGGVDGIIVENFGDVPFVKNSISKLTLSHFTNISKEIIYMFSFIVFIIVNIIFPIPFIILFIFLL